MDNLEKNEKILLTKPPRFCYNFSKQYHTNGDGFMAIINYIEKHLKTFTVKQHKHLFWEIIYVTDGKGVFTFENGEKLPYQKGQIVCIPPNLYHVNTSSVGFKNIHLTLDSWTPSVNRPILIQASNSSKDLYTLMELAYKYFQLASEQSELLLSLARAIVASLDFLINAPPISKTSQTVQEAIINNYTDCDFSLDSVYASIPYSKEYVRKIFIKEHGLSPLAYLTEKRIDRAKQLLLRRNSNDSNYSIKEIAETCGFSDQLYFSRCFKKITGVAPKAYKLTILENNKVVK